jgi:tellurium resistance protein TerD
LTCFFDASHGPATQEVTWTPQWGAPRPVRCCAACAQRWMEYLQAQSGYPQPGGYQQGYPQPHGYQQGYQQGYPQPGYPQPDYDHDHRQRRQFGLGSVAAAGAAGFVGGMVVNELLDDDDEHEHVEVIEHVVHDDDFGGDYGGDW